MSFKDGQYVTGVDRSYQRSIYQIVSVDGTTCWPFSPSKVEAETWGVPQNGERAVVLKFIGLKGDGVFRTIYAHEDEHPPLMRFELWSARGNRLGFEKEFRHATSEELSEVGINI